MRKALIIVAALAALALPTTALAGAQVDPNRYCANGLIDGLGVTVETPSGMSILVCRAGYTVTYQTKTP